MKWNDPKYGEGDPRLGLRENEPYFFLRAQDLLSTEGLRGYAAALRYEARFPTEGSEAVNSDVAVRLERQARDVDAILAHFEAWQKNHADVVKLPD
jgi:hypothetical protein